MRDVDPALYDKTENNKSTRYMYLVKNPDELVGDRHHYEEQWKNYEKKAQQINPNLKIKVPYWDRHIVGEHNGLNNGNCVIIE